MDVVSEALRDWSGFHSPGNRLLPQRQSLKGRGTKDISSMKLKRSSRITGQVSPKARAYSLLPALCQPTAGFQVIASIPVSVSSLANGENYSCPDSHLWLQGGQATDHWRGDIWPWWPHLRPTYVQLGEGALHRGLCHPAAWPQVSPHSHSPVQNTGYPFSSQPMATAVSPAVKTPSSLRSLAWGLQAMSQYGRWLLPPSSVLALH
jgi:hypothetical protein